MTAPFAICLLHEGMLNKNGEPVTTSLTLIDIHDISRAAKTYGLIQTYIAHPAEMLRKLANTLTSHWQTGYGASYNPDRKSAIDNLTIVSTLSEIKEDLEKRTGLPPKLIATSAKGGDNRMTFKDLSQLLKTDEEHSYLLMLGTGWGMDKPLLDMADYFLEPINGPTDYNHLSVRSACAICLDRLLGR